MSRIPLRCGAAMFGALLASLAVPASAEGPTTFQRLTNPEPQNWLLPHRTYNGWRYSELEQITPANVGNLKLTFAFSLGSFPATSSGGGEIQPLVDDGFMYVTNTKSVARKLDVRSGKRPTTVWSFDPDLDLQTTQIKYSRGAALLDDKAIINTMDGRVIAVSRASGEAVWQKRIGVLPEGFSSQPFAVKDKVMVGNSRGDQGTRGYVAALAIGTGAEVWRFWTVPGPGEPGHETWPANTDAWKVGGGAIWAPPSYDVAANLLYYGTGNASPAYDPEYRAGDNLYTSSLVVLNADTGKVQWHFQYLPNEGLERDEVTPNILIDTTIGGAPRKVVAHHSTRGGFFYTLDRTNGAFINAQKNAPTVNWTAGIDPKTGKPLEYDPAKKVQSYAGVNANRTAFSNPGCQAATSWGGQAYNPTLNRVYSLVVDSCFSRMTAPPTFLGNYNYVFGGVVDGIVKGNLIGSKESPANPALDALRGGLVGPRMTATDVATGMMVAFVASPEDPTGNPQGGTLATKSGLVFFGHGDGTFSAYDASTMAHLWSINTGTPLRSPPITYAVGGKQYVAISGGGDGTGVLADLIHAPMLWVFTL